MLLENAKEYWTIVSQYHRALPQHKENVLFGLIRYHATTHSDVQMQRRLTSFFQSHRSLYVRSA